MQTIKKKSLVDHVYEIIRKEIITLQLPLGSKLNVSELEAKLGVSCTPIREAINRLQQEGLVEYTVNVGAHVLTLTKHDAQEIQQLAMTLHGAAIRLAMECGDRQRIAVEFKKHLDDYCKSTTINSEVTSINRMIGTFYHNCGNKRLDKSMISIQGQQLLLRYAYAGCLESRAIDESDFGKMLDGILNGDTQQILRALEEYTAKMTAAIDSLFLQEETVENQ